MKKSKVTKTKTTTPKRPVGLPRKTAATNVTVTPPKKQSAKAATTRELTKAVKGKNARPSTTPPLYDTAVAFKDLERHLVSSKTAQSKDMARALSILKRIDHNLDAIIEAHNRSIRAEIPRRRWPFGNRWM